MPMTKGDFSPYPLRATPFMRSRLFRSNSLVAGCLLAYALLILSSCTSTPPRERTWLIGKSPHFEIFSTMDEIAVAELLRELEQFRALFYVITGIDQIDAPIPTKIFALKQKTDYQALGGSKGSIGIFKPGLRSNSILLLGESRWTSAKEIILHEYVHFLLRTGSQIDYPIWYEEGFAELLSTARQHDDQIAIGAIPISRATSIQHWTWVPLRRVLSTTHYSDFSADSRHMLYAESWALVHYLLLDRQGERSIQKDLNQYLANRRAGVDAVGAFELAFGVSPGELDKTINKTLRKGIRIVGLPTDRLTYDRSEPLIRIAAPLEVALQIGQLKVQTGRWKEAEPDFARALQLDPLSPRAHAGMGDMLKIEERWTDAETHFARAIELASKDPLNWIDQAEFLYDRALATNDTVERKSFLEQARTGFRKASELDPDFPESLLMLGRTYLAVGEDLRLAREPIERAYALLPSSPEVMLSLAELYTARGEDRKALRLLVRAFGEGGDADTLEQAKKWIETTRSGREKSPLSTSENKPLPADTLPRQE